MKRLVASAKFPLLARTRTGLWWSILRNSSIILFSNLVSKVLVFVATTLIARAMGPQQFGWYALVLAFVGLVAVLPEFGTDSIMTRDMARLTASSADALGAMVTMRLVAIFAAMVLSFIGFQLLGYSDVMRPAVAIATLFVLSFSLGAFAETYFRAQMNMGIPATAKILAKATSLLLVLAVLHADPSTLSLLSAISIMILPDVVGVLFVVRSMWSLVRPRLAFGWTKWKPILSESWPIALTSIFMMIYLRIDVLFLSRMVTPQAVGNYAAAFGLVELLGGVAMALGISLIPVLARLAVEENPERFWKTYQQSYDGLMFLLIPVCFFFVLYAEEIVSVIYGPHYELAGRAASLLIWAQIFTSAGALYTIALIALGRQKLILILASASAVVNVVANLVLIPLFGIFGAAVASILGYGAGAVILFASPRTRAFITPLFRASAVPVLASLLFVAVARALDPYLALGMLLCGAVYLVSFATLRRAIGPRFEKVSLTR